MDEQVSSPERTHVIVRTLDGKQYQFDFNVNSTLASVKSKLVTCTDVPEESQRLLWKGEELQDDSKLSQYSKDKHMTLFLVVRFPGSGLGVPPPPERSARVHLRGTVSIPVSERVVDRVVTSLLGNRSADHLELLSNMSSLIATSLERVAEHVNQSRSSSRRRLNGDRNLSTQRHRGGSRLRNPHPHPANRERIYRNSHLDPSAQNAITSPSNVDLDHLHFQDDGFLPNDSESIPPSVSFIDESAVATSNLELERALLSHEDISGRLRAALGDMVQEEEPGENEEAKSPKSAAEENPAETNWERTTETAEYSLSNFDESTIHAPVDEEEGYEGDAVAGGGGYVGEGDEDPLTDINVRMTGKRKHSEVNPHQSLGWGREDFRRLGTRDGPPGHEEGDSLSRLEELSHRYMLSTYQRMMSERAQEEEEDGGEGIDDEESESAHRYLRGVWARAASRYEQYQQRLAAQEGAVESELGLDEEGEGEEGSDDEDEEDGEDEDDEDDDDDGSSGADSDESSDEDSESEDGESDADVDAGESDGEIDAPETLFVDAPPEIEVDENPSVEIPVASDADIDVSAAELSPALPASLAVSTPIPLPAEDHEDPPAVSAPLSPEEASPPSDLLEQTLSLPKEGRKSVEELPSPRMQKVELLSSSSQPTRVLRALPIVLMEQQPKQIENIAPLSPLDPPPPPPPPAPADADLTPATTMRMLSLPSAGVEVKEDIAAAGVAEAAVVEYEKNPRELVNPDSPSPVNTKMKQNKCCVIS